VLIKACLNGSRTRAEHPAVPLSPSDLAADAAAVVAAGAGAVHFHPRNGEGAETLDAAWVGPAIDAVRGARPGIPAGVTTALWISGGDATARLRAVQAWTVLPDFASVNLSEEGIEDVGTLLADRGVPLEAGIWTLADVGRLSQSALLPSMIRVLVEPFSDDPQTAIAQAREIDNALLAAGIDLPQVYHGVGLATWAVIGDAARRGRDVRVGLEDTTVLPGGAQARDNAALVAAAVEICR